jgi:hypothetical protein
MDNSIKLIIMRVVLPGLSVLTLSWCFSQNDSIRKIHTKDSLGKLVPKEQQINAGKAFNDFSYIIIEGNQNGFGYDIIAQGKVIIHQPYIPAISGNKGFRTKEDAQKIAQLVIYKLNKNIIPPSVTKKELDSLQLKF